MLVDVNMLSNVLYDRKNMLYEGKTMPLPRLLPRLPCLCPFHRQPWFGRAVASCMQALLMASTHHFCLHERSVAFFVADLLEFVTSNQMLVTCCIEAHFTAFQVLQPAAARPPARPHGRQHSRLLRMRSM